MKYDLKLYVYQRPDMRSPQIEFIGYIGKIALDNMFEYMITDEITTELFFVFPERFLNIIEERCLYSRIEKFYPNVTKVIIMTQSVYLIQCTKREDVLIVQPNDGKPIMMESDVDYFDPYKKRYSNYSYSIHNL